MGTPPPKTPTTPTVGDGKEVARSAKLDGLKVDTTDDKTRNKCIELIYDSLCVGSTARACSVAFSCLFSTANSVTQQPTTRILRKAQAIEQQVLADFGHNTGKEYKDKMRSLFLNLKDKSNPSLREGVVDGDIPVAKLCKMSPQVRSVIVCCRSTTSHSLGNGLGRAKGCEWSDPSAEFA